MNIIKTLWQQKGKIIATTGASLVGATVVLSTIFNSMKVFPSKTNDIQTENGFKKPFFIGSHGIGSLPMRPIGYAKNHGVKGLYHIKTKRHIIDAPTHTFTYGDVIFGLFPFVNFFGTDLAQYHDLKKFCLETIKAKNKYPNTPGVTLGISRGAATVSQFASIDKQTFNREKKLKGMEDDGFDYEMIEQARKNMKIVILEASFDHAQEVFKNHNTVKTISKIPGMTTKKTYNLFEKLYQYKHNSIQPIETAKNMADSCKVITKLFVITHTDPVVTSDSTVRLALEFFKKDPDNTYLLILNSGGHGNLLGTCNDADAEKYQSVVNALYKKCGLTHDKKRAKTGETHLKECQPTIEELKNLLKKIG